MSSSYLLSVIKMVSTSKFCIHSLSPNHSHLNSLSYAPRFHNPNNRPYFELQYVCDCCINVRVQRLQNMIQRFQHSYTHAHKRNEAATVTTAWSDTMSAGSKDQTPTTVTSFIAVRSRSRRILGNYFVHDLSSLIVGSVIIADTLTSQGLILGWSEARRMLLSSEGNQQNSALHLIFLAERVQKERTRTSSVPKLLNEFWWNLVFEG
jgi:hypothetical protein